MSAFFQIDLPILATALFAALLCALLGNFLVLRRESLLGDAISHAVLPGIVLGFLVAGSAAALPVLAGAGLAGLVAILLIRALRDLGRVEPGAAMGTVFTAMFALGVLLLETAVGRMIHLDGDAVLYGQLEAVFWPAADGAGALLQAETWRQAPRQMLTLAAFLAIAVLVVALLWKELKLVSFDPAHAAATGLPVRLLEYGIGAFVALAAIGSFEAVGSILVVALLICPAATARLLTDRYGRQIGLSLLFGAVAAFAGYGLAVLPSLGGAAPSLNAAGMIALASGLFFALAFLFGPRHGLLGRVRRAAGAPRLTPP